jgi:lipopolysaccharide/colanic/teichoic acid biosynthesis glycosyltransferase
MQAMLRERARFDRIVGGRMGRRALTPAEQMWMLLERYRSRSDRYGQGFSVAVFRSDGSKWAVRRMARLIAGRARLSDEVGWLEGCSVCVILPDTQAAGAMCFASAVVRLVSRRCPKPQFTLYTYPSDALPDAADRDDRENGDGTSPHGDSKKKNGHNGHAFGRALSHANGNGQRSLKPVTARQTLEASPSPAGAVEPLDPLFVRRLPWWKRMLDIAGSAVLLVLTFPIIAAAAIAVRLGSSGPILFCQRRAGLGGKPFTIYKFRTMKLGAESEMPKLRPLSEQDGPAFKLSNDPRLTGVGAFLRKTSIDELPQLWNVLKGEMSLVGPRPLPLDESAQCTAWQRRRLEVTPGLTCVWQVKGRSRVTFEQWARMDVGYLTRRTLAGDLKLLLQTIPAVLLRRGAR